VQNATKQTQHGNTPLQRIAMAKQSCCCFTAYTGYGCIRTHMPRRMRPYAECHSARLILNGDNMLGLCDPSNLLLVLSAEERRSLLKLL